VGQRKIKKEKKNYLETNGNEHATYQNPWDAKKAVIGGKFIAGSTYVKRLGKIWNQQSIVTPWGTIKEQTNPKARKGAEITK